MVEQVQSSRAGRAQTKEAGPVRDLANISQHRQKGLWSFLTWAFFVSQMLGMQQAFAAAARVEAAADNASEDSGADPAQAASAPLQPLGRFTGGETIPQDAAPMGEASTPNVAPIMVGAVQEGREQPGTFPSRFGAALCSSACHRGARHSSRCACPVHHRDRWTFATDTAADHR